MSRSLVNPLPALSDHDAEKKLISLKQEMIDAFNSKEFKFRLDNSKRGVINPSVLFELDLMLNVVNVYSATKYVSMVRNISVNRLYDSIGMHKIIQDSSIWVLQRRVATMSSDTIHQYIAEIKKHSLPAWNTDPKAVVQLDMSGHFIKEYKSTSSATLSNNFSTTAHIISCMTKKRKSAYGYKWVYANEYHASIVEYSSVKITKDQEQVCFVL